MPIDPKKATQEKSWTMPAKPVVLAVQSGQGQMIRAADGSLHARIALVMAVPQIDTTHWEYQIQLAGSGFWDAPNTVPALAGAVWIDNVATGSYLIRIRSRRDDGRTSAWLQLASKVTGKSSAPPAVPIFFVLPGRTAATWYYDSDHGVDVPADLAGFELRYNLGTSKNWEKATPYIPLTNQRFADLSLLPQGVQVTVMICAVDVYGNRSAVKRMSVELEFDDVAGLGEPSHLLNSPMHAARLDSGFWITYGKLTYTFGVTGPCHAQVHADVAAEHWSMKYQDAQGEWHPFLGSMAFPAQALIRIVCEPDAHTQAVINQVTLATGPMPPARITQGE